MRYKNKIISWLVLFPISWIYTLAIFIRNKLFDFKIFISHEFEIPIVSVGNINVGGTGKTPHVEYLISILANEFSIATLSRGYKRKTKGFKLANDNSTASEIGDEAKQIKLKFPNIEVAVDEKRARGIKKLLKSKKDYNAILLDDAYQHRQVTPGISILLVNYHKQWINDYMLPMGTLREKPHEMQRANIIIMTKCPENMQPIERRIIYKEINPYPYQNLYFTTVKYGKLKAIYDNLEIPNLTKDYTILLVTGIANKKEIIQYLKQKTDNLIHIEYRDHYSYEKKDLMQIQYKFTAIKSEKKIIITTEKDFVKFVEFDKVNEILQKNMFYLPIEIEFLNNDTDDFYKQITNYVRTNKRYSSLYFQ